MSDFSEEVLRSLWEATVIFTTAKGETETAWSSGMLVYPDTRLVLSCAHNFAGCYRKVTIARHPASETLNYEPEVIFSDRYDVALVVLISPLPASPLEWAAVLKMSEEIAIPDYVPGSASERFENAWRGKLTNNHLEGHMTERTEQIRAGSHKSVSRWGAVNGIHPGLSGSAIISPRGKVVGQVSGGVNGEPLVETHMLKHLKEESQRLLKKAKLRGLL